MVWKQKHKYIKWEDTLEAASLICNNLQVITETTDEIDVKVFETLDEEIEKIVEDYEVYGVTYLGGKAARWTDDKKYITCEVNYEICQDTILCNDAWQNTININVEEYKIWKNS